MLVEFTQVRQINNEPHRRWFTSTNIDLIVWFSTNNAPTHFELCYDKQASEKALSWGRFGFAHTAIDDGDNRPGKYKASPLHTAAGAPEINRIYAQFLQESSALPEDVVSFVLSVLSSHPSYNP